MAINHLKTISAIDHIPLRPDLLLGRQTYIWPLWDVVSYEKSSTYVVLNQIHTNSKIFRTPRLIVFRSFLLVSITGFYTLTFFRG